MDCPYVPELSYSEFGERLRERLKKERVPLSGTLELTFRCNLRCVHCYAAHGHQGIPGQAEMSYEEICDILDQLVDEGCLWLLLTGGDPLLRADFLDIYTYAKRKGFLITVFTNGTLITPQIADYLVEWPPFKVEITLYGRTRETYERVTGIPGSYDQCMRGIDLLLERGIRPNLKTMLMTLNKDELWDIKHHAESVGANFRFDPMVNAGLDGSLACTSYRLAPEEVVAFDLADPELRDEWEDLCVRLMTTERNRGHLYACGAGLYSFHIDPYAQLSICMTSRLEQYDLRTGSFSEGWHRFLRDVRFQPHSGDYACDNCALFNICGRCPGWAYLECGDQEAPVEYLCQIATLRAAAFELESYLPAGSRMPLSLDVNRFLKREKENV